MISPPQPYTSTAFDIISTLDEIDSRIKAVGTQGLYISFNTKDD